MRLPRLTLHETYNTLKNQGYNFEHNYGHGNKHMCANFAMLMFLAFGVDQILQASCHLFQKARERSLTFAKYCNNVLYRFLNYRLPGWTALLADIVEPVVIDLRPAPS